MAIDKRTVEYTAHLARIELGSRELETISKQLQDILDFIDKLKKADVDGISATSHILPVSNVLREDLVKPSLSADEALKNAPSRQETFFIVPKVIE
ncbi:MAG: Asp-tRNA(Asn)/Glu-tRNA(Gln) amidotransferase subunit GatC [Candidatus Omnitrophota bacterium]